KSNVLEKVGVQKDAFVLVTIHRNNNTDNTDRLRDIFETLDRLSDVNKTAFVIPLHPRTRKMLGSLGDLEARISENKYLHIIPPASYLDMICLEANAEMVVTDSGGVQKEAYYFEKPCVILQGETPWVELVSNGCAELVDADPTRIEAAFYYFRKSRASMQYAPVFGDGKAAEFTIGKILEYLPTVNA
ncbi:MAG: UDP-N-acetylglucosamine 2-epimerase, partial [Bacteroidota bacterium]